MSQTSKVNLAVRNAIIAFLAPGTKSTNGGLRNYAVPTVSRRAVQEATQKLTVEGVLVASREFGKTWYELKGATKTAEGVITAPAPVVEVEYQEA